jgi:GAF domain-containing protein
MHFRQPVACRAYAHCIRLEAIDFMQNPPFNEIVSEIARFVENALNIASLQEFVVNTISARLPHYNWVGFYMLDPADPTVLILGPFRGAPTEHARIPLTEGICGAAVAQDETVIVDDVFSDPRYLSCSIETKSEIVVPIRAHGKIVGEIDIDSHDIAAFGLADRSFLEKVAVLTGGFIEMHS